MKSEWREVSLGDVALVNPEVITSAYPYERIEYIDISSVGVGEVGLAQSLNRKEAPSRAQRVVRDGDVILSTVRPNRRSFAFLKQVTPNTIASTGFAVLRAKEKVADSRFIYCCIFDQAFTDYLESRMDGSAYPAVSASAVSEAKIQLPPLAEQKAIARILGSLDDKIELNRRMNATLEHMAQTLFRAWFVDFEPVKAKMRPSPQPSPSKGEGAAPSSLFSPRDGAAPSSLPSPFEGEGLGVRDIAALFPSEWESSTRLIPKGWEVGVVSDLADVTGGKQLHASQISDSGAVPVYGGNGIMGFTTQSNANPFAINFGRVGAYCGNFYWSHKSSWINNNASLVKQKDEKDFCFVLFSLRQIDINSIKKGAAQPFVSNGDIAAQKIVIPSQDILQRFNETALPLLQRIGLNNDESQTLARLRDALLPRLVSGALRVPDAMREVEV